MRRLTQFVFMAVVLGLFAFTADSASAQRRGSWNKRSEARREYRREVRRARREYFEDMRDARRDYRRNDRYRRYDNYDRRPRGRGYYNVRPYVGNRSRYYRNDRNYRYYRNNYNDDYQRGGSNILPQLLQFLPF